jgi:hypothetical protein
VLVRLDAAIRDAGNTDAGWGSDRAAITAALVVLRGPERLHDARVVHHELLHAAGRRPHRSWPSRLPAAGPRWSRATDRGRRRARADRRGSARRESPEWRVGAHRRAVSAPDSVFPSAGRETLTTSHPCPTAPRAAPFPAVGE